MLALFFAFFLASGLQICSEDLPYLLQRFQQVDNDVVVSSLEK
jgi:hypothetical protein